MRFLFRTLGTLLTAAAIIKAVRTKEPTGTILGIPYDLKLPTPSKIRKRFWNPEDPRIFTPHLFGVGWSVNLYQIGRRFGLVQEKQEEPPPES